MRGSLNASNMMPILPLQTSAGINDFLVDTGFSGDLAVDPDIASILRLQTRPTIKYSLTAGGGAAYRDAYAEIEWFGESRTMHAVVWTHVREGLSKALIGTHAFIGYVLIIDFNEGVVTVKDPAISSVGP